jgi:hypothetical protein
LTTGFLIFVASFDISFFDQTTLYLYLKILFNKCHINQYNLFNQVGLVALNILGDSNIHDISPRIG